LANRIGALLDWYKTPEIALQQANALVNASRRTALRICVGARGY
jgi:hypothetical protein